MSKIIPVPETLATEPLVLPSHNQIHHSTLRQQKTDFNYTYLIDRARRNKAH